MAVQNRTDVTNLPFILSGDSFVRSPITILQDAGRVAPLVFGTVMGRVTASGKYVPADAAAVDGSDVPRGIFLGDDIPAADLVAGDVVDQVLLVGSNCTVDEQLVVLEADLLDDALTSGDTMRDALNQIGIFPEDTIDIDSFEN